MRGDHNRGARAVATSTSRDVAHGIGRHIKAGDLLQLYSEGAHVIADFSRFTGGWNSYDTQPGAILVGDIRFAMLPTSSKPLWSVRCAPGGSLAETTLVMDRGLQDGDLARFGALLSGSDSRFIEIK